MRSYLRDQIFKGDLSAQNDIVIFTTSKSEAFYQHGIRKLTEYRVYNNKYLINKYMHGLFAHTILFPVTGGHRTTIYFLLQSVRPHEMGLLTNKCL